jgi:hypothetical protein
VASIGAQRLLYSRNVSLAGATCACFARRLYALILNLHYRYTPFLFFTIDITSAYPASSFLET